MIEATTQASILAFDDGSTISVDRMYDQTNSYDLLFNTTKPRVVLQDGQYVIRHVGASSLLCSSFTGSLATSTISVVWRCSNNGTQTSFRPGMKIGPTKFFNPWHTVLQGPTYYDGSAFNTPYVSNEDRKWRHHALSFAATTVRTFENGTQVSTLDTVTPPDYDALNVGQIHIAGDANYDFVELRIFEGQSTISSLFTEALTRYPTLFPATSEYGFVGDSISTTGFCGLGSGYPGLTTLSGVKPVFCRGGFTLQDLIDRVNEINQLFDNTPSTASIITVFAGTNTLLASSGAQGYADLKTLVWALKDGRPSREVCVITPLPRFETSDGANTTFEAKRQIMSDLMVADTSGDFDYVLDTRTLAIGVNGVQDDTTYFVDFVHMNLAGNTILAAAIDDLLTP